MAGVEVLIYTGVYIFNSTISPLTMQRNHDPRPHQKSTSPPALRLAAPCGNPTCQRKRESPGPTMRLPENN